MALPALTALLEHHQRSIELVAVVTQPDRPARRGSALTPPPTKELAQRAGIPVYQPESLRDSSFISLLSALAPDIRVVPSYAQLLPRTALRIPRTGWLNIHPSLLPRHRGPAPVVGAILAGDTTTGVTIIRMVRAMDAGPIVDQIAIPVPPRASTRTLLALLGTLGAQRLMTVLQPWTRGEITAHPQDESLATTTHLLTREDGAIRWEEPAWLIERKIRAYDPWPRTFSWLNGRRIAILEADVLDTARQAPPGTIVQLDIARHPATLAVVCGEGGLAVTRLQAEGRMPLSADQFASGWPRLVGSRFTGTPREPG
ncbi:MAG: methionyl-tRNA formyltransferase [Chloroflexi bacterium]|nr:methionyl-tRNA formyltransferase [Chloroflexota bacterium]